MVGFFYHEGKAVVHMTQDAMLRQGKAKWRQFRSDPRVRMGIKALGYGLGSLALSAVSLGKQPQPLALGFITVLRGWRALAAALGGMMGYRTIWGDEGDQGLVWSLGGCGLALLFGKRREASGWLMPAVSALTVSVTGLIFQLWLGESVPVGLYWLRVLLGAASARLFQKLSYFWSAEEPVLPRKGEVATAQVQLEIMAGVLDQTQQLLLEVPPNPIDQEALLARTRERACGGCPNRKGCGEVGQLNTALLTRSLTDSTSLGIGCKKPNRLLLELRRSQEQLRAIRADRDRRKEYRAAVEQQYQFLSEYLQDLSDAIARRSSPPQQWYQPEVAVVSASRDRANGDRCLWFAGVECRYYILLCDGMGTGQEAAREGQIAGNMLRKLLSAGYPPEHALRSLNSLCALQGSAGAVTVDLAELRLDTGKATLYKWGAAPSYVFSRGEPIKIGTATPPPGLSVTEGRETVEKLSLRRGETLVLLSDGASGEDALRLCWERAGEPVGELAAKILEGCQPDGSDDATVAVVRLSHAPVSA